MSGSDITERKTLQDYEVVSVIGSGTFGTCFKVLEKNSGRTFAWKGIDYDDDELTVSNTKSLISEINVLRQLKHPNIVEYYHHLINHEAKSIFIVMEYCEGGDLAQLIARCRIERSRFEENYIWRVLFQVCKAVQLCHNKIEMGTILHRDIKPANIFLDSRGNAKLGDFGLARILCRNENYTDTFVGTPSYMSPEIVEGSKYDRKSDVWAVGCLIHEMSALRTPFKGRQFRQLSKNISTGKFDNIPNYYSMDLQKIISIILEKDNKERPTIEVVIRHPVVVRNIHDLGNDYPKLIERKAHGSDKKTVRSNLNFSTNSMSTNASSLECETDKCSSMSFTPSVYSQKSEKNENKSQISDLLSEEFEAHKSLKRNLFEIKQMQDRLNAIHAKERSLRKREAAIYLREQELVGREKRIEEKELSIKMKNLEIVDIDHDASYCSVELNDTMKSPTIAKLDKTALLPLKSFPPLRRVTFKSPGKTISYDKENASKISEIVTDKSKAFMRTSTSSKGGNLSSDNHSRRKSLLSILGFQKAHKSNKCMSKTPEIQKNITQSENGPIEILDKYVPSHLAAFWTDENKRAAFSLLASMNKDCLRQQNCKTRRVRRNMQRIPQQQKPDVKSDHIII